MEQGTIRLGRWTPGAPRHVLGRNLSARRRWVDELRGRATRLVDPVGVAFRSPKAQAEARWVVRDLVLAARRARRVGVSNALDDKQVLRHLRGAANHASNAAGVVTRTRPPRRLVRAGVITAGASALASGAYAGWRSFARHSAGSAPHADGDTEAYPTDADA